MRTLNLSIPVLCESYRDACDHYSVDCEVDPNCWDPLLPYQAQVAAGEQTLDVLAVDKGEVLGDRELER